MITSNDTDKILPALFKLKKMLKPMTKDSKNPFFKSNYLELPDLLDNLEPLVDECGLIISQANCHRHGDEYVISRLTHATSGQFVEAEYKIGFNDDPQKNGARSTYGRRYSLKGLVGISEKDDDGNFASGKVSAPSKSASQPAKVSEPVNSGAGFSGASTPSVPAVVKAENKPAGGFGAGGNGGFSMGKTVSQPAPADKPAPAKAPARSGSFGG